MYFDSEGGYLQVSCTEDFRVPSPLGKHHLGTLHVEQTLNAVGTVRAQVQQGSFKERLSIVFDHSDDANKQATPHHAGQIIDELCRPDDRVGPDVSSFNTSLFLLLAVRPWHFDCGIKSFFNSLECSFLTFRRIIISRRLLILLIWSTIFEGYLSRKSSLCPIRDVVPLHRLWRHAHHSHVWRNLADS